MGLVENIVKSALHKRQHPNKKHVHHVSMERVCVTCSDRSVSVILALRDQTVPLYWLTQAFRTLAQRTIMDQSVKSFVENLMTVQTDIFTAIPKQAKKSVELVGRAIIVQIVTFRIT